MENLKARHSAALTAQRCEVENLQDMLTKEQKDSDRLRRALDELAEDLSREGYGRRREISLRLTLLTREERLREALQRWLLKSREALDSTPSPEQLSSAFRNMIQHAEALLQSLDRVPDSASETTDSSARLVLAQSLLTVALTELEVQANNRTQLEKLMATRRSGVPSSPPVKVILSTEHSQQSCSSSLSHNKTALNDDANDGTITQKFPPTSGPKIEKTIEDSRLISTQLQPIHNPARHPVLGQ